MFLLRQRQLGVLSLSAAAACISTATSRGVLGPLSGDDSCKPLVQFKGWLECNKTVLKADQDERPAFRNKYTHNNCGVDGDNATVDQGPAGARENAVPAGRGTQAHLGDAFRPPW